MGTDPLTAVNILQDMGVDALGVNCSLGPKEMIGVVKEFFGLFQAARIGPAPMRDFLRLSTEKRSITSVFRNMSKPCRKCSGQALPSREAAAVQIPIISPH